MYCRKSMVTNIPHFNLTKENIGEIGARPHFSAIFLYRYQKLGPGPIILRAVDTAEVLDVKHDK